MKILLANRKIEDNAAAQIAHPDKAGRAIFCQSSKISSIFENKIERFL